MNFHIYSFYMITQQEVEICNIIEVPKEQVKFLEIRQWLFNYISQDYTKY